MTPDTASQEYLRRFPVLDEVAANLVAHISAFLQEVPHVDRVIARAKDPSRFAAKAARRDDENQPRYEDPLGQIQDQIGARITVFYLGDVKVIGGIINTYFTRIEERALVPESDWEFGYFGKHWILSMPKDVVPEGKDDQVPRFFELQVKTLFQHAWSEANHDLAYKPETSVSTDQLRRLAFAAAQAWGGDQMFEELRQQLLAEE